ncbi:4-hydroxythreonine-4-phosphate dehydrogenase PdxA [Sphingomonas sp. RP10(2022)]|uniref:4-hydroxythreonine-4-phosphate dehydrogenase n=1 Tax=Sphingomonas liriopis TaxID=2949094 RepID=A0A9X2HQL3_9SPHN|nr:4-hydroxythreonine-4-phosphate dehydrogenase PdxA [Sphingomonas liriopis]MCP3733604.1 4-hydroxythreonine-4-phosphate dehydrogenase PdxA [Sphingomonas liriopis]
MTTAPLAIPMGDPAGIGPEIIAKSWAVRALRKLPPFALVGDPGAVRRVWNGPVETVGAIGEAAAVFDRALPVLAVADAGSITLGTPEIGGARAALQALDRSIALVRDGEARALVTGPVSKAQLYGIGFNQSGQTEFVAERCGVAAEDAVMMLAGPSLRVVPITAHVPLAQVSAMLSVELIVAKARTTAAGLRRDFGIAAPRLAFAGFNPHAGESGMIGREEIDILAPAIAQLRAEGIDATGPFAADTLFHARARTGYDVVLCCYHDQALVPIKTLHFDEGVNVTLGLPIVRTSPDHGTAFGIAGTDQAHPGAMIAAIAMAGQAADRRARA